MVTMVHGDFLFKRTVYQYTCLIPYLRVLSGWNAAPDIARRTMVRYTTPMKRGQVRTMLTVDNV